MNTSAFSTLRHESRRSSSFFLWPIIRAIGLVLILMLGFLTLAQRSMIFFPMRGDAKALEQMAAERGLIPWSNRTGDLIGYRTSPWQSNPHPPISILILHGNAGHAAHRADYVPILQNTLPHHAISVFILEYPGYGARPGNPSQDSFLAAASDALDVLPPDAPVILLGESIGTGVAAGIAKRFPDRIAGLLLLTPFDSLASVAQFHYPMLPVNWILRDRFPSADWLQNYHRPITFILAANDTIVPATLGQKLHDSYTGPKKLLLVEGSDHNDLLETLKPADWHQALSFLLP